MIDERPDALLRSALEKIVYFEARSEQLHNDLTASRSEVERLKSELGGAAQREISLRRQVAEMEVRAARAHQEKDELARINEALRAERTQQMGKLLEASRIQSSDKEETDFDLASFISELRSEVLSKPKTAPAVSPLPPGEGQGEGTASRIVQHATRFQSEGRLTVSRTQVLELSRGGESLPGRSEETLFGFSVRELSAPDAQARVRAAERLKALAHPAATPALAAALNSEEDPKVQVALLGSFAAFAPKEGIAIVTPLLQSPQPDVRIAALKALMAIDPPLPGRTWRPAIKDPDQAVRRRSSLLALGLAGRGRSRWAKRRSTTRTAKCELWRLSSWARRAATARAHSCWSIAGP